MGLLNDEDAKRSQEFLDAFRYAQKGTPRPLQLGKLAFLYRDKKYYDSIKVAHAFADYYVDKALEYRKCRLAGGHYEGLLEEGIAGPKIVLLHDMAMETDNREDLRNQILHAFLEGHESSPITTGNALFQLCRHPDKWAKLREEVLDMGINTPEALMAKNIKGSKYLLNIIKETLRLYPVASMSTKTSYKDNILPTGGGPEGTSPIFVEKGTIIHS